MYIYIYIYYIYIVTLSYSLLYQKKYSMPACKRTKQYNMKFWSMKDYKRFFINTRSLMSLLENHQLKITNYNIEVSNENGLTQEGHLGVCHTHETKPPRLNIRR